MKFIGHVSGIAACREAIEEYQPEHGSVPREMIELVRSAYAFQAFPVLALGAPPPTMFNFGAGKFSANGESFGINQLVMSQDGDMVLAVTTEQADLVLNHLMQLLDENLGFRLGSSDKKKSYVSNVIVEFDSGLEIYISKLAMMETIINNSRIDKQRTFKIKRVGFGAEANEQASDPLVAVETADFLIERRVGRRFEENRYFCSAPMPTKDHLRVLAEIDAMMRGEDVRHELVVEHTRPRMAAPPSRRRIKLKRDEPI